MSDLVSGQPCGDCGASVFEDANFCSACGASLVEAPPLGRVLVVKDFARGTLEGADQAAREILRNEYVKKVAGGALVGACAATVVPFLTFTAGATLGAAFVGYKLLTKD